MLRTLQNIIPSINREKGYSKILISENVVADTDGRSQVTSLNVVVVALNTSGKRTERSWRAYLKKCG